MERVITSPAVEPITVAEAKVQVRELAGWLDNDDLILGYIAAARDYAEQMTGRALMTQTIEAYFSAWTYTGCYFLRKGPVQTITKVEYIADGDSTYTELSDTNYYTDLVSVPARVVMSADATLPTLALRPNAVRITFTAGNTQAGDVPPTIRQAMLLLIGMYYEKREDMQINQTNDPRVRAADALLRMNRPLF